MTVRVVNDTGLVHGTSFLDDDGRKIEGVRSAKLTFEMGNVVKADLELVLVATDVVAHARYMVAHPVSGELREVRSIEFADGEVMRF